jgi:uncharacterized protein
MTLAITLRDSPNGCMLPVRVHPGARKNDITGVHDGALKISLTTPPTDGRANEALIAFIAARLHIPRSRIAILTGTTSRSKILSIASLSAAEVRARLAADLPGSNSSL